MKKATELSVTVKKTLTLFNLQSPDLIQAIYYKTKMKKLPGLLA